MKATAKKLKAKHFRYLSKENIKNPMDYLVDFYKSQTNLAHWLDELNTLVNTSFCARMKSPLPQSNGYNCKRLIKQIEFAYALFTHYDLKKKKGRLTIQPVDYRQISSLKKQKNKNAENYFFDTIRLFFSFKSLNGWYKTLDRLWVNLIDMGDIIEEHESIGEDQLVIIKELFTRLAIALHLIYEMEELPEIKTDNSQKKEFEIAYSTALKKTELSTSPYSEEKTVTNKLENTHKRNFKEEKQHQLNTNKSTVLEKLRECFLETSLDSWQAILHALQQGITTNYDDWNEAFEESHPSAICYYLTVITELIGLVEVDLSTDFTLDKIDFPYADSISNLNKFTHHRKVMSFRYISQAEISNPEYYLHILSAALVYENWILQLNEVTQVYLSLEPCGYHYENQHIPHFLVQLQKFIELCYLIAFKDEIEFVNTPALEPTII